MKRFDAFAEVEETVVIRMPKHEAERIQYAMADLLCWAQGFKAACPEDCDRHPMGVNDVRSMRDRIRRAIEEVGS